MSHPIPNLKPLFPIDRFNFPVFDFINQVDRVYRGLGIPTLYGVLSKLANKSVLFIGERGTGKTRTINLIPPIGACMHLSKSVSTRKISKQLKEEFDVQISHACIARHRQHFLERFRSREDPLSFLDEIGRTSLKRAIYKSMKLYRKLRFCTSKN